ncbi:hypothetical protein K1T36_23745 [Pseudomonas protegens]|uniref:hypothetical protein n=1 Tax=Pseudomonas protegens TaxID=380021 RepID=UPI001C697A12|nr:hypothetical protein [Pseudomonas protegens]QYN00060.1 hypothetical protein K1T36_23745 [Pseudomonas protegens]
MDDHGHIAIRWWLLGHFISAITSCLSIYLYGRHLLMTALLAALYLLWLLQVTLYVMLLDIDGFVGLFVVYASLATLAAFYKTGGVE